jgi:hypothetical protein
VRFLRPLAGLTAAVAFATAACTASPEPDDLDTNFAAQMASSWHWTGDPQRVQVGILASGADGVRPVTGGTVDLSFAFLGADGSGDPVAGPTATASFIPVPGTATPGDAPGFTTGANGVYEAEDVVFDEPGFWQVTVTVTVDGVGRELAASLGVSEESPIPAPGDRALKTENLTLDSEGVPDAAIDSMAANGGEITYPELHEWTIARAIREGRPALVLFGTPAFCVSRFCGPEVEELQRLADEYPDRAVYIHVEIWRDFYAEPQEVNRAAADWLLRKRSDGTPEMTEPWLYLIGSDGVIVDRWGSLFDPEEVAAALEALPPMSS